MKLNITFPVSLILSFSAVIIFFCELLGWGIFGFFALASFILMFVGSLTEIWLFPCISAILQGGKIMAFMMLPQTAEMGEIVSRAILSTVIMTISIVMTIDAYQKDPGPGAGP